MDRKVQRGHVVLGLARARRTFSDRRTCYDLAIEAVSIKFETARSFYAKEEDRITASNALGIRFSRHPRQLHSFQCNRDALANADAHRCERVAALAEREFQCRRARNARA